MKNEPLRVAAPVETKQAVDPVVPTPWNKWDWLWVGIVFALALGLRWAYWLQVHNELWFINPIIDSEHYHQWAQAIGRGDWLGQGAFEHSPLYAYFLALFYKIIGVNAALAAAFQLGLGACCCGLIYILARRFFSPLTAAMAGMAQAVYGLAFFHEGTLLTVVLIQVVNLLLLLTTYWASQKPDWKRWAIPGVFLGLSFLARPNIALYLGVLVVWIGLLNFQRGWAWLLKTGVVLSAAFMLVVLPSAARNMIVLHEWMLSVPHAGMNFYIGNSRQAKGYHSVLDDNTGLMARYIADKFKARAEKELGRKITYGESSSFWYRKAWQEIAADPGHWQQVLLTKFLLFFNHYEYTTSLNYYAVREFTPFLRWPWIEFKWVAPLALLGMFWLRARWKELLPLYGFVLVYLAGNMLIMVSSEYRYAVMPAFFIFAAHGASELAQLLRSKALPKLGLALVLLGVFYLLVNLEVLSKNERDYHMGSAHTNFGHLLYKLGNLQGAGEEYTMARDLVKFQPEYLSGIQEQLGRTYNKLERYPEAQQVLEDAYALTPDEPSLINELAMAATANGQIEKALMLRKRAIELEPEKATGYVNLGVTYLWARQDRLASAAFSKAVSMRPDLEKIIKEKRAGILQNRQ
jgi:4-amino-4-deoxy-L-arabinose transferase-like glycosyltransferase